ncbi:MAG: peptide-methionine (R)-S-oxide reductase MsrB [Flavobacteriaceae bacterium]|nr:peptide-methionine (R)-S-oxide reductase MsrB [Flavobacteriaceae bacterium]
MNKYPIHKTEEEWLSELGEERYRILRQKGTERPFTGTYNLTFDKGSYQCGACSTPLFKSDSKFESGCGWPSFDEAIDGAVEYVKDTTFGMIRTEILCATCGSHLGHVFNDGPTDTGQRYCVNSLSVDFKPPVSEDD